ncbi:MAG: hypothetical protein QOH35_3547 [Acidobacteriaceae bacterium]|jgi:hypothetical protein|nr:hypothetical protein [Acidobacteriaceae bacterium]
MEEAAKGALQHQDSAKQNQKSRYGRSKAYTFKCRHDASPDAIPWEQ